jgi:hypothetical protein
MPPGFADVQVPGVTWTFGQKQERIVEVLRESETFLSAREIAAEVDCSKRHVQQTLDRDAIAEHVQVISDGPHGATLYADAGVPNTGVVELGSDHELRGMGDNSTAQFAIRDPDVVETAESTQTEPSSTTTPTSEEPSGGVDPGGTGG